MTEILERQANPKLSVDGALGLHPEGMSAISRGLSEATPPEEFGQSVLNPEGMPARFNLSDI